MLNLNRKGRVHSFFLGSFTQDGGATIPYGDIVETDFAGSAPVWTRQGAGQYCLTFPSGSMNEDPGPLIFCQIKGTSAALYVTVSYGHPDQVNFKFRDEAGTIIEADCGFDVLLFGYGATIPA